MTCTNLLEVQSSAAFLSSICTLVIIDSGVEDYQTLANGVISGAEVIILDRHQNGIEQITQTLQKYSHITHLHIVSHGSPGCLYLGTQELNLETIGHYSDNLRSWSLASILLYGCNVAAGDAGAEFIDKLHQLTGASIAASTTPTGHAALGANWDLDYKTVDYHPQLAFDLAVQATWMSTLPGSSFGKEFWLAMPRNYNGSTERILYISGASGTTGTVEISGIAFSQTYSIGASGLATVAIPANAEMSDGTVLENKGIHVTSSADVGVYGLNFQTFTSDAYTGFPVDALGTDYLVISNTPNISGCGDQITIVGTQDNTSVILKPLGGSPTAITLNKGQVYQFESYTDLTGTSVTSSAPVAVFTGNQLVRLGLGAGDFTVEQLTPTQGWDDQYLIAPTPVPERHRILASQDGTVVKVDGTAVATLNRGQFYEYTVAGAHDITASAPILVAKLIEGTGGSNGDPALVIMQSPNNFITAATFATPTTSALTRHTVTIVTTTADTGSVQLDGAPVSTTWTAIGSSGYSWTRVTLTAGEHKLISTAGFGATVYGDGSYVSYAYVAGSNVLGAPPLAIDVSSDTGISSGDNITNDTTPTFTGTASTAKAGDIVTIYVDGVAVGTGVVQSDRSWSVTTSLLSEGIHAVTSTLTSNGKQSPQSTPVSITIDTTAPEASAPKLAPASDTGAADGITSQTKPTFTGTAEANSTVQIFDGATQIGTATADDKGAWSFTPTTELSEGEHSITIKEVDVAGNVSSVSSLLSVTIDTTAPEASAPKLAPASDTGAADGITSQTKPTFTGTAEANSTVQIFDGATQIGTATADDKGAWSFTPTTELSEGEHSITIKVEDITGNVSAASSALSVKVDTTAPGVPATPGFADGSDTGAADGITSQTKPTFTGTVEANSKIQIFVDGDPVGTGTADDKGVWSFTSNTELSEGNHSITIKEVDVAGNVSPVSNALAVKIDTTAPTATEAPGFANGSDTGAADGITSQTKPTFTGTAEANSTVQIFDGDTQIGTATANGSGVWSFTPNTALDEGNHSITTKVVDGAGNISPASGVLAVKIDTTAPTAAAPTLNPSSDTGVADGITSQTKPTFTGIAEANSTIQIFDGDTQIGTATANSSGVWSFTPNTALNEGNHSITIKEVDVAGNISPASGALSVKIDTTAPTAPSAAPDLIAEDDTGTSDTDNATNKTTPTFAAGTGTGTAGDIVTLYVDGNAAGTATVEPDGSWSVTPSAALTDGTHNITVTYKDPAGNESDPSAALEITIDGAPTTPSAAPDLIAEDDTGTSDTDNATNKTTPTFAAGAGSGTAGDTVTLYVDGNAVGTATVQPDGSWSVAPSSPIANGTHNITVTYTDPVGNESTPSAALSVKVDTTAPGVPATPGFADGSDTGAADGITSQTKPTFTGKAEANSTIQVFDGNTQIGIATANSSGAWSFTPNTALSEGNHSITIKVVDVAGHVSPVSSALAVKIDTTAPTPTTNADNSTNGAAVLVPSSDTGAADGITSQTKPTFTGKAEANSTIQVFDGNTQIGTATADDKGSWNFTPTIELSEGDHSITIKVVDVAGNVSPASSKIPLTIDTKAPTVTILGFGERVRDTAVNTLQFQFSEAIGSLNLSDLNLTLAGKPVDLTGASLTTADNKTWTLTNIPGVTESSGNYQISIKSAKVTDRAGNLLQIGADDTWITGYTADARALPRFRGKLGIKAIGNSGSNRLEGSVKKDVLRGGGGNDSVLGKQGSDRMFGNAGNDILNGGSRGDLIQGGTGNDRVRGGRGNDVLLGGAGNDQLVGGNGQDFLNGGGGKDILKGGRGKDTYAVSSIESKSDLVRGFNAADDLIDLRGIFAAPQFAAENRFAQYYNFVKLTQVGGNTEVQIDLDGSGSGNQFGTVLTLQNTTVDTVQSTNFVVG